MANSKQFHFSTPNVYQIIAANQVQQANDAYQQQVNSQYNEWLKTQQTQQVDANFSQQVNNNYNQWLAAQNTQQTAPKQTTAEIPSLQSAYIAQNDKHRDYGGKIGALERTKFSNQLSKANEESRQKRRNEFTGKVYNMLDNTMDNAVEMGLNPIKTTVPEGQEGNIGYGVQQLDLSKYKIQMPETDNDSDGVFKYIEDHPEEAEYVTRYLDEHNGRMDGIDYKKFLARQDDYKKAQAFLDPSYKMTKEEEKWAQKYAKDNIKRLSSKPKKSQYEIEELRTWKDLKDKTSEGTSFVMGATNEAVRMAKAMDRLPFLALPNRGIGAAVNLTRPARESFYNMWESEPVSDFVQNQAVQNPIATGAGNMATQAALYGVTNPAVDTLVGELGLKGAAAWGANQLGQFGQDLALDTIPRATELAQDGNLSADDLKKLAIEAGINIGANAAFSIPGVIKDARARKLAEQAEAARQADNEIKTAVDQYNTARQNLEDLNGQLNELVRKNEVEALNVNPLDMDNEQFNNFMRSYNNQFKDTSAMRDVYNAEDLDSIMNNQLKQAMEDYHVPEMDNPRVEMEPVDIPELDEYAQMWSDNIPKVEQPEVKVPESDDLIPNIAENTQKAKSKPKNIDLPEEVVEKAESDFYEIYDAMGKMRLAAEATENAAVMAKYEKLSKAVSDYERAVFRTESTEEVIKAKKAADAARQGYVREMKKIDPNYTGELTGTKLGNAAYRRTSMLGDADANQALADSFLNDELELRETKGDNRFAVDAEPEKQKVFRSPTESVEQSIDNVPQADRIKGSYNLQTFADGAANDQWKYSKMRTNSMEKSGQIKNPDDAPIKDYAYRVEHGSEQLDTFNERYKDSKNVVSDLLMKDQFDAADMRGSVHEWEKLMSSDDIKDIRKANRLGKKMAFEGREGGRTVQAIQEMNRNTPGGQLREAQQTINDAIDKRSGQGTSEALDNLYGKIEDAFNSAKDKDDFIKKLEDLLSGDLKDHVSAKTARGMKSKRIKGLEKVKDLLNAKGGTLNDATFNDIMEILYKSNGGVPFSAKAQHEVYKLLTEAANYDPKSYQYKLLQARAARKVMAEVPAGLGDYIRAFLYDNMLGNFKTAFSRNFLGNVAYQTLEAVREIPTAGVDWATSKITKKRSATLPNLEKAKAYGAGFKKGMSEQTGDVRYGVSTTRSGETSWKDALKNNRTIHNDNKKLGHLANQVDFYVEAAMKYGDRGIYEGSYAKYKTELEQLLNRYGKNGVVGLENVDDADIPAVIDMLAQARAADSVFQQQGFMSKGLTEIRNGLGNASRGVFGVDILSTAATPFTLTPGNMLERAIEYTPLGLLKNGVQTGVELAKGGFDQRRFAEQAGRSLLGLPILGGMYAGAKKGLINGGYSTDPDEKAAQQEDGFIEYGYNVPEGLPVLGGKTLDTSDLPVIGPFMQVGSVVAENGLSPESSLQALEAVVGGSATQGIRKAFGADASYSSQNSVVDNLANTVKSSGSQFVPSLVRQTAQTVDPYKRDMGEYGTDEYYLNLVKNSIPGLRQTLPVKTDVEGNPVLQNQGRGLDSKILENYVLPMNMSEYNPSELNVEATRLRQATGDPFGFAQKAKRSDLRGWDEKAKTEFTEEQFRTYKQDLGKLNSSMGHALIESDYYKGLDDATKNAKLKDVYEAMKAVAKHNATGLESDNKLAAAYMEAGGGEKGSQAVINTLQGNEIKKEADISASSKAGKAIDAAAKSGDIQAANEIADATTTFAKMYGDENAGYAYGRYELAKSKDPSLTVDKYTKTLNMMDGLDGEKKNGQLSQKEFLSYVNTYKNVLPESRIREIFNVYGKDWKGTLYINKKGNWAIKTK